MCVVCVSAITVASLVTPTPSPVVQNNVTGYTITNKACPKSKVNKIENNKICLKDGRVYRWAIKTSEKEKPTSQMPTPSATQPQENKINNIQYSLPSESGDSVEKCKIKELSNRRNFVWSGFPNMNSLTKKTGTVKWALIPIDFPDLRGEPDFRKRVDGQMKTLSDWFFTVSEGKFKVEWVVLDRWATLPKNTKDYAVEQSLNLGNSANGMLLFRDAMTAADPLFDFTNIQQVNFILPKGQTFLKETSQGFPWDQAVKDFKTQEGSVDGFTIPGQFFDNKYSDYWSYWAHEFGHSIGLPHVGSSRGEIPPFNPWDIMGGQDGPSKDLSGWLRFLAGWMSEDKIFCKSATSLKDISLTLVPLTSNQDGIKFVVMPLPSGKALLIESRRVSNFSCVTKTPRNGVLVYIYDPMLGHNEDFLVPVSPQKNITEYSECNGAKVYGGLETKDILLRKGDSVFIEGIKVEVVDSLNLDKIIVKKQ